jgi:CDP-diacylglycerol---glycerol-3-phosphate 3-phosphatidyltransferase
MNLPNKLTVTRIVLTAVMVAALLLPPGGVCATHFPYGKTLALAIFIVASLTDWLDGWIARVRNQHTNFGALLDPLADKILTMAAFICFIEQKNQNGNSLVQAWMVLVIVARDFLVTGLRLLGLEQGVVLKAEWLGKHKTTTQMITIIIVLLGLAAREEWHCFGVDCGKFNEVFSVTVFWLMVITVALTLWSGIAYLYKNRQLFLNDV